MSCFLSPLTFHFYYLSPKAVVLKLLHASESPSLLKYILMVPNPQRFWFSKYGEDSKMCVTNMFPDTQIMLMLLVRGSHFKNHCPKVQVPFTLRGNLFKYSSRTKTEKLLLLKFWSNYYSVKNKPQLTAIFHTRLFVIVQNVCPTAWTVPPSQNKSTLILLI